MKLKLVLGLGFVIALLAGAVFRFQNRDQLSTNMANLKGLIGDVANSKELVLYEGLPHPSSEPNQFRKELKNKKVVHFNDFAFYQAALNLSDEDAKQLRALFVEGSFKEFGGVKKCGGFHPDYLLEWKVGDDVYRAHLCFGCQEMKVYGPKSNLHCDMTSEAWKSFKEILKPYQKNRPAVAP